MLFPQREANISHDTLTTLHGRRLWLARLTWLALVGLVVLLFVTGLPITFSKASLLSAEQGTFSPMLPALYWVALDTCTMLGFLVICLIIFWRRSNDWMAMFVTLMLMLTALVYTATRSEPRWLLTGLFTVAELSQLACLLIFPNGRFVPHRSWVLLVPLFIWRPVIWFSLYLPNAALQAHLAGNPSSPQHPLDVTLLVGVFAVGVVAQRHRYRSVSTPTERQQTKWLLVSAIVAIIVSGGYSILINLPQYGIQLSVIWLMGFRTLRQVAMLLVPIALMYAILHHRLWAIDLIINRALVYGMLTTVLAGVYAGCVALSFGVVNIFTGQALGMLAGQRDLPPIVIVASTLAIAALFQPLRRRIQLGIDRYFYRSKYDAQQTLASFSARLRHDAELETLTNDLLHMVQDTLQPTHVSLWLRESEKSN